MSFISKHLTKNICIWNHLGILNRNLDDKVVFSIAWVLCVWVSWRGGIILILTTSPVDNVARRRNDLDGLNLGDVRWGATDIILLLVLPEGSEYSPTLLM